MMNEFCKGGGCTAKLGPGILDKVLKMIPKKADPKLLVGFDHSDDAAVYQLTDELAVVQTLDFFPPMVEDPYLFGKIAATNALSDIYAMGGEVKTALNIVCFPESMDANILGQILLGGNEKVTEAGGVLAGGHSINDVDVKYGLSVMGTIHPKRILENNHCKEGDLLLLTKPLGVGIVMTASRMRAVSEEAFDQAVESMTTLNKYAAEILKSTGYMPARTLPDLDCWYILVKCWAKTFPQRCGLHRFLISGRARIMWKNFTSQPQDSATATISVHRWHLKIAVLRWKRFYLIRRLPGDFLWQSRKMRPKRR